MKTYLPFISLLSGVALVSACSAEPEADEAAGDAAMMQQEPALQTASAELTDADGNVVGTATLAGANGGLTVSLSVTGMPEGEHGAHIHMVGQCTPPDFTSAGDHWNPGGMNHGTESDPPNPHAGDLPNIVVGADGTGSLESATTGTLAEALDADGAAIVVHADPDDYTTQPSGNSGARIACGVFSAA